MLPERSRVKTSQLNYATENIVVRREPVCWCCHFLLPQNTHIPIAIPLKGPSNAHVFRSTVAFFRIDFIISVRWVACNARLCAGASFHIHLTLSVRFLKPAALHPRPSRTVGHSYIIVMLSPGRPSFQAGKRSQRRSSSKPMQIWGTSRRITRYSSFLCRECFH
ncbi:hypothetical protein BU24DRAFT_47959 [Aaosphaeria arxii CBS 175.79]|uniref:Uncharacterized protein n=1 Tax=Aaosphaeria arxii CBS 175.79 TaxID=1450172 RepID=A0A6A5XDI8_9PLEO|nr:uncharacterized protein BU24DRAFT_47959 [Aaosphaeria arxii CBS 175.79]KAF2010877.1 hypothetical protein BU24DRAFT_47959 [Aaosphaeria arxii CBS 175.79]